VVNFAQIHKGINTERYAVLVDCRCLSADGLDRKYLYGDGEHPCFDRARWRDAVMDEGTIIGRLILGRA
jgi:hypothetical protein